MPWAAISKNPGHYFVEDSLPEGVTLVEPSKLRAEDVTKLWRHWRGRQKDDIRPVVFAEALAKDIRPHTDDGLWPRNKGKSKARVKGQREAKGKGNAKGKGKARYVEVDDSPESSSDESSSDESSEESSEESSSSSSEEGEIEDLVDDAGEPITTGWGPAGVHAKRPKVQIITQAGSSGLSPRSKQALLSSSAKFWKGGKGGKKGKKAALWPITELEDVGSAGKGYETDNGVSAE